ncbi:MAG: hypothetical protein HOY75_40920 [Streptomyces sp.]|nr:hypothetical protein [Streptomyces sp.]
MSLHLPADTTYRRDYGHGLWISSLCSGVGGLDLGVQAALGGHNAWHTEDDPPGGER